MSLSSERLDLIPMSREFLYASLRNDTEEVGRLIGAAVPSDWPGEIADVLRLRLSQLDSEPSLEQWLLRAMVLRDTGRMVGYIGFHTAPGPDYLKEYSPGAVEFGFGVFPDFQRRGFAREAAEALMGWARIEHGVRKFILTIRPDNEASKSLAARLGFVRIGSHIDEVDGLEDILELKIDE